MHSTADLLQYTIGTRYTLLNRVYRVILASPYLELVQTAHTVAVALHIWNTLQHRNNSFRSGAQSL